MSRHKKVKALDYDAEYDDYYGAYDEDDDFDMEEDFEAKYLNSGIDLSASESNNTSYVDQRAKTLEQQTLSVTNDLNLKNDSPVNEKPPSKELEITNNPSIRLLSTEDDENEQANLTPEISKIAIQHLDKFQWQLPLLDMDRKFRDNTYYKHYSDTYISSLRSKLGHFLADNKLLSNPMKYHKQNEIDNYRKYSKMFELLTDYYQSLGSGFFSFATPSPDEQIVIGCRMGTKVKKQPPKQSSLAKCEQTTARFEYSGKPSASPNAQQLSISKQKKGPALIKGLKDQASDGAGSSGCSKLKINQKGDLTIQEDFTAEQLNELSKDYREKLNIKEKNNKRAARLAQAFSTKLMTTPPTKANISDDHVKEVAENTLINASRAQQSTSQHTRQGNQPVRQLATLVEKRQQLKQHLNRAIGISDQDMEAFKLRALQTTKEYNEFMSGTRPRLNLVVVGHVDAGKSTLVGHLLFKLGQISSKQMHRNEVDSQRSGKASFKFAWALDETTEERERGVTIDIALTKFETTKKDVVLLDAPGHVDFIPAVISGAAQADAALLVVDATRGEFETGLSSGGQTREHTFLVRSLGVKSLIVIVNKMDNVDWNWSRFCDIVEQLRPFLKQVGFDLKNDVQFIAASGLTGENLVENRADKLKKQCSHPQLQTNSLIDGFSKMPSLVEAIDRMPQPERMVDKPTRICVTDVFRGMSSGVFLGGKVVSGKVEPKQKLLLVPPGELCEIKQVEVRDSKSSKAFAGDIVTATTVGIDSNKFYRGCLLCDPIIPCNVTNRFQARIVMFQTAGIILIKGSPIEVHINGTFESGQVRKLMSLLNKTSGELIQKKPRCVAQNSSAIIQLRLDRVVCCELYEQNRDLGRFMMRSYGKTIAAGLITKIKSAKLHKSSGTKIKSK